MFEDIEKRQKEQQSTHVVVTLKHDSPIKRELSEFKLKDIDKDKLYKFLREMEFNRYLSSAISTYGEPELSSLSSETKVLEKQKPINNKNYHLITDADQIDEWINEAEEKVDEELDKS